MTQNGTSSPLPPGAAKMRTSSGISVPAEGKPLLTQNSASTTDHPSFSAPKDQQVDIFAFHVMYHQLGMSIACLGFGILA